MFTYLFGMSRRWEMALLLFSGVCFVYTLRVNISVSATAMETDLGWTNNQKGLVLSSFYWGYTAGQIPASKLIQRYGGKWIFGFSILIPGFLTLICPMVFRKSFGGALFVRCMLGFFESASFPAVYYFFHEWIPSAERTLMVGTIVSGTYLGEILGFALSGYLLGTNIVIGGENFGQWPATFYVFGLLSIVWFPLWAYFAYDTPALHPGISKEEKELICGDHNSGRTGEDEYYFVGMLPSGLDGAVSPTRPFNLPKHGRSLSTVTINKRPPLFAKSIGNGAVIDEGDVERLKEPLRGRRTQSQVEMKYTPSELAMQGQPSLAQMKQSLLTGKDIFDMSDEVVDNNSSNNADKESWKMKSSHRISAIGVFNDTNEFDNHRVRNTDARKSEFQDLKSFQKDIATEHSTRKSYKAPLATSTNDIDNEDEEVGSIRKTDGHNTGTAKQQHEDEDDKHNLDNRIPWYNFFTYRESLVLFFTHFVFGYIQFMLISEMPSFLVSELGFSVESAGGLSSVPFVFLFLTVQVSGRFFDYMQKVNKWEVYTIRQAAQISSYVGVAIFLIACGFATEKYTAFALLVVAQAVLGISLCGIACAYLDVAPVFSCPMNTVGNTLSSVAGIIGPLVVAQLTSAVPGPWGWRLSFILCGLLCVVSSVLWRLFQTSSIVSALNTPKDL